MTTAPPRITHNANEHEKFMLARGNPPLFPKVTAQVASVLVNRRALPAYAYNGSIVRHGGRLLLAYRYHEGGLSTRLGVAELDDAFNVTACHALTLPGRSQEDPRWHTFDGGLYLSWVESDWPTNPPHCVIKFGQFHEWQVLPITQPTYGKNDFTALEKNWSFFESELRTWAIYDTYPEHVVIGLHGAVHKTPGARWRYGKIRGGVVVRHCDSLVRFFHSAIDGELPPYHRRYFVGALVMEHVPPFRVVRVIDEPLVVGSEDDDLTPTERSACIQWKAKVAFPMGAIADGDGWLLSCGINDSHIALLKVPRDRLKL